MQWRNLITFFSFAFLTLSSFPLIGEEVLFEDTFEGKLSEKWQIVGLEQEDYRIRNGGLELKVQPGKQTKKTPMLKIVLPFKTEHESPMVRASVEITILDPFTEEKEFAGLYLIDEFGAEFGARKQLIDKKTVFTPPRVTFNGKPGEEGDFSKYSEHFASVKEGAGPNRIIVRGGTAFFQVGPSNDGKYQNFFFSAVRKANQERGFAFIAAGGPTDKTHWVRFDNFRVVRD